MPQSTNAPFNEFGHSMVLRDIEYLSLKLQELFDQVSGQPSTGDLQPGGGQGVSQQVPDDAWGAQAAVAAAAVPTRYFGTMGTVFGNVPVPNGALTPVVFSPPAPPDTGLTTSGFTVPATGNYMVLVSVTVSTAQFTAPYLSESVLQLSIYLNGAPITADVRSDLQMASTSTFRIIRIPLTAHFAGKLQVGDLISARITSTNYGLNGMTINQDFSALSYVQVS